MSFKGFPDWHQPPRISERALFAVFEQPGAFFASPVAMLVAENAERVPEFRLDLYRQDRGTAGLSSFGLLSARFRLEYGLADTRQSLLADPSHLRVDPLVIDEGVVRFTSVAALEFPETMKAVTAFDRGGTGLSLHLRLNGADADLFLELLRQGLTAVFVETLLQCRGVAARVANVVSFDAAALHAALWGGEQTVSVQALYEKLKQDLPNLPLQFSSVVGSEQVPDTAMALLDRIAELFGQFELPQEGGFRGPWLRARTERISRGEMRIDLAEPALARRGFYVEADPLGSARTLSIADLESRLVRHIDVNSLGSGWHRITVVPNMPSRRVGVMRIDVDITAPASPPSRPQTSKVSVGLDGGQSAKIADLRLSPNEALRFQWHTIAQLNAGGKAETVEGPLQKIVDGNGGAIIVVSPAALNANFAMFEAEPSFLKEANIEIHAQGRRGTRNWSADGVLDESQCELAVYVPADLQDATLTVTAVSRTDGLRVETREVTLANHRFDPFDFPGTGVRHASLERNFDAGAREIVIECAPQDRLDDKTRRQLLRLQQSTPNAGFSYVALSPFRNGFCWRYAAFGEREAGLWSQPLDAGDPAMVPANPLEAQMPNPTTITMDGVELTPIPGEPRSFFYRATAAGLATDEAGRKQLSFIEAGPVAMLALTGMWGVEDKTLERVRERMAKDLKLPNSFNLIMRHAPVEVDNVELWLGDGAGHFKPLLTTTSSGMPPFHAAFNSMLTAEQAPSVKKALKGERGLLGLRYAVTERPSAPSGSSSKSSESHESSFTSHSSSGASTSKSTHKESHSGTHTGLAAEASQAPEKRFYDADAADWGLAA